MSGSEYQGKRPGAVFDYLQISIAGLQHGVMLFDAAGRVLHANPAAEAVLGLSLADMQASRQKINDWNPLREDGSAFPTDQLPLSLALTQGLTSQHVVIGDARPDGSIVWISVHAQPIFEQGQVVAAVVSFEDITEHKRLQDELRNSHAMFAEAEAIAHVGSWSLDLKANRLSWSDEVYRIFGLLPQSFAASYEAFLACVHPDDRAAVDAAYSRSVQERRDTYEIEHRVVRPDGTIRHVLERCQHLRDAAGVTIASHGMVQDITERVQAQLAQAREYERFQHAVEAAPVAMLEADAAGIIVLANPAVERMFGYAAGELLGQAIEVLLPDMLRERHVALRGQFAAAPATRQMGKGMNLFGQRKDGSTVSLEVGLGHLKASDGALRVVAMVVDISERQRLEEMEAMTVLLEQKVQERTAALEAVNRDLTYLVLHDSLTGLHNRRAFTDHLRDEYLRMQRTGERYAIVLIDIDHFKRVNDGYGHEAGDIVLKHVAATLQASARATDFGARLGGEEFIALLPNTAEGARVVAEKMRLAVAESSPPVVGKITISLGVAVAGPDDANEATALNAADQAMYRAKGEGRNRVVGG